VIHNDNMIRWFVYIHTQKKNTTVVNEPIYNGNSYYI